MIEYLAGVVSVAMLCGTALAVMRWRFEARRFEFTHKNTERDEALSALEPRMRSLEERLKAMEWRVK